MEYAAGIDPCLHRTAQATCIDVQAETGAQMLRQVGTPVAADMPILLAPMCCQQRMRRSAINVHESVTGLQAATGPHPAGVQTIPADGLACLDNGSRTISQVIHREMGTQKLR